MWQLGGLVAVVGARAGLLGTHMRPERRPISLQHQLQSGRIPHLRVQ